MRVTAREGLELATIIGHRGRSAELDRLLSEALGAEPAETPQSRRERRTCDLIWSGSGPMALSQAEARSFDAADARPSSSAWRRSADQSDARAVLRLSGRANPQRRSPRAVCIDLHPGVFRPGDVALTAIAHIGVQLWQLDDGPTYELAVFRSMAMSFWSWFQGAAAESGYEVIAGDPRN